MSTFGDLWTISSHDCHDHYQNHDHYCGVMSLSSLSSPSAHVCVCFPPSATRIIMSPRWKISWWNSIHDNLSCSNFCEFFSRNLKKLAKRKSPGKNTRKNVASLKSLVYPATSPAKDEQKVNSVFVYFLSIQLVGPSPRGPPWGDEGGGQSCEMSRIWRIYPCKKIGRLG